MPSFFKGEGTQKSPFNKRARHILRALIKNPRMRPADLVKDLSGIVNNITDLRTADLHKGPFADAVRYRVDLNPLRYRSGAGTCFINVKLHKKGAEEYHAFETGILSVCGIIEWDKISGDEVDYLVRIAGKVGDNLAEEIAEEVEKLPNVKSANMNRDIVIWKSGVVDSFEPDQFLEIDEE